MRDPFSWSIDLGRWAGIQVRLHLMLVAFVVLTLLEAALAKGHPIGATSAWLLMLLVALALHELAHAVVAWKLQLDPEDIHLWPLGNLSLPLPMRRSHSVEAALVAAAGPAMSLALALSCAIALNVAADAQMIYNPFGNAQGGGAPLLADGKTLAAPFTPLWVVGWFGYLNWVLFLANLLPAYPLDGGKILRGLLDGGPPGTARDNLIGPWTASVCAILLGLVGLIRFLFGSHGGVALMMIGLTIFLIARLEARLLEEGGLLEDSLFGYDFSQGYTSLEAGSVERPAREGAFQRWRRRRSEQRHRRLEAKQFAEEQRMDEILEKLHRDGRASLTAEEQRFLVRVSARYRNRSKTGD